jgi:hypothetical protein
VFLKHLQLGRHEHPALSILLGIRGVTVYTMIERSGPFAHDKTSLGGLALPPEIVGVLGTQLVGVLLACHPFVSVGKGPIDVRVKNNEIAPRAYPGGEFVRVPGVTDVEWEFGGNDRPQLGKNRLVPPFQGTVVLRLVDQLQADNRQVGVEMRGEEAEGGGG